MSDDLDQVVDEAPVADPAPEPTAEPVAEPAAEPATVESNHQPTFLDERQVEPQAPAAPQWTPEQVAAYRQQQMMAQQPQPQQPSRSEEVLNRFVQNPDGTISEIAAQQAYHAVQQAMQQQAAPVNTFIAGQTRYFSEQADHGIRDMYASRFNKDETFASNEAVRQGVDNTINGLRQQAIAMAQSGDPSGFAVFSNPRFADTVLAMVKTMSQVPPTSTGAAPVPHVQAAAPAAAKTEVTLTPDQEEVIARYSGGDPGFRERYIAGLQSADKHGDFQG